MRLLIITQKVDKKDPVLGFFHSWIIELSKSCESLIVICLEKGEFSLPNNVKVLSLGKEERQSRLQYLIHFYWYIQHERNNYDQVFVHMNQQYVILAGWLWKLWSKRILFWRNHPYGSLMTRLAVWCSDKVFCTSEHSFTARFKKTVIMPAGIDTDLFKPQDNPVGIKPILYLGRISSIKNVHILIGAMNILHKKSPGLKLDIFGDKIDYPEEQKYYDELRKDSSNLQKEGVVSFCGSVTNEQAVSVYNSHSVLVNLTGRGSFDKVVLEMMSCGKPVLVSNESFRNILPESYRAKLMFKENDSVDLAVKLDTLFSLSGEQLVKVGRLNREKVVKEQSLKELVSRLVKS
jgi:glycosyltransferase involved in cell wall biosynthesis